MVLSDFNVSSAMTLLSVFVLMVGFSSALDMKQFLSRLKRPKGVAIGICCQYILLPLMAFLITELFIDHLLPEQRVGLIVIATMPGGAASNVFCFLFGADLSLSIAMTTCSSLSSFLFITLNTLLYIPLISEGHRVRIDYVSLLFSVAVLIAGVLTGLWLTRKGYDTAKKVVAVMATVIVIAAIFFALIFNFFGGYPLWQLSWCVWVAPLILTLSAWFVSFGIAALAKLQKSSCVAIGIECSNQNAAFAIAILVLTLGSDQEALDIAVGIPIVYSVWNYVVIVLASFAFRRMGYLEMDELDKAVTFRKLVLRWRESKKVRQTQRARKETVESVERDVEECAGRATTTDSVHSVQSTVSTASTVASTVTVTAPKQESEEVTAGVECTIQS